MVNIKIEKKRIKRSRKRLIDRREARKIATTLKYGENGKPSNSYIPCTGIVKCAHFFVDNSCEVDANKKTRQIVLPRYM